MKLYSFPCAMCGAAVFRHKGRVNENKKLGLKTYCSKECLRASKIRGEMVACARSDCMKVIWRSPKDVSIFNYCSRSCAAKENNKKYPKRVAPWRVCQNSRCRKQYKGASSSRFCSPVCKIIGLKRYEKEELLEGLRNLAKELGRTPAKREAQEIVSACIFAFGGWNQAVISAGLLPNRSHDQRMYKRTRTKARDGHLCDSISEAIIDDWLTTHNIPHERDVPYPIANHKADWGVKDAFIEYFGLANDSPRYDRTIQEKQAILEKHEITLISLYPIDLYPIVRLEKKLFFLTMETFSK